MPKIKASSGFTLIEVLISISILAVIAVISIPNLKNFNQKVVIKNVAKDLANQLRTAQTNARTYELCPDNSGKGDTYPTDWDVVVQVPTPPATGGSYYLRANCYNPTTGDGNGVGGPMPGGLNRGREINWPYPPTLFPPNMTVSFTTCYSTPPAIGIDFTAETVFNDCWGYGSPYIGAYTFTISDGTNTAKVNIDSGGNITTQ